MRIAEFEQRRDAFKNALSNEIAAVVKELKRDDTVAMSRDNLWALVARFVSRCPLAPQGTNCMWVARQYFNEIIDGAPGLRRFTTI